MQSHGSLIGESVHSLNQLRLNVHCPFHHVCHRLIDKTLNSKNNLIEKVKNLMFAWPELLYWTVVYLDRAIII